MNQVICLEESCCFFDKDVKQNFVGDLPDGATGLPESRLIVIRAAGRRLAETLHDDGRIASRQPDHEFGQYRRT